MWVKKRKGSAHIYKHEGIDKAIVHSKYGDLAGWFRFGEHRFVTLEEAKEFALTTIKG